MNDEHEIPLNDFFKAQEKWVEFWHREGKPIPNFHSFIGNLNISITANACSLSGEGHNKILLINGPYGLTVLKMLKARGFNDHNSKTELRKD